MFINSVHIFSRFIRLQHLRNRFETASSTARRTPGRHRQPISDRTVRRRLQEADLRARRPYTGPILTPRHRRNRNQWARNHLRWTRAMWRRVLFTDESKFRLRGADGRTRVWRRVGERFAQCCVQEVDRWGGGGLMVWGGISYHSRSQLHVFPGRVNGQTYRDQVLAPHVMPFFAANPGVTILQQDNARAHTSRVSMTFLQARNVQVLPWPALSPDMAPIEHVWDILGQRVSRLAAQPQNLQQLQAALQAEWWNIPQRTIQNIINSMRSRCIECVRANGGHTRY